MYLGVSLAEIGLKRYAYTSLSVIWLIKSPFLTVLSQVFIHDHLRYDLLLLSTVHSEGER